ncbi:putative aryl-alcohol dehydrogenase [Moniliophthora roreri]|nr:putative aryl-alcohol dehydrogenase [Moniliophthora roreri]
MFLNLESIAELSAHPDRIMVVNPPDGTDLKQNCRSTDFYKKGMLINSAPLPTSTYGTSSLGRSRSLQEEDFGLMLSKKKCLEWGEHGQKRFSSGRHQIDVEVKVSRALEKVATEFSGRCMQKKPDVFPSIGGRKVEQRQQILEVSDITPSSEQIKFLEGQVEFEVEFQMSMIGDDSDLLMGLKMTGMFDLSNMALI